MSELDEQIRVRKEKLQKLRELGEDIYPHRYEYDRLVSEVREEFDSLSGEDLERTSPRVTTPGRITAIREHGKVRFLDISDGLDRLQVYVKKNTIGDDRWEIVNLLDLGDHIGIEGTLLRTRTGELTLAAEKVVFLAKSLRPLPEKYHGMADVELRYRKRYLDLISSRETREIFLTRARVVNYMRNFLNGRGYLEVETPMMQTIPGGATAKPFVTHHNTLDMQLYLRVAPELFLKRLIVGGIPRVYEINRNFRNEGISTRHNPEFTMLEFYEAYSSYEDLMELTEQLISGLVQEITGGQTLSWGGHLIDVTPPWKRLSIPSAVQEEAPGHPDTQDMDSLRKSAQKLGIEIPETSSRGSLIMELFEHTLESKLIQPTFVVDFPVEVSPLAKGEGDTVHRFELIMAGMEIANAYCELNDPQEQGRRFEKQVESGEGKTVDMDFIEALEHGMPPTSGEGIGVDRLIMLLTGKESIREVILFPLLRPRDDS